MTAFAALRGDAVEGGGFNLQLRSVNHRSLKVSVHGLDAELESKVSELLRSRFDRGCIDLFVQVDKQGRAEEDLLKWVVRCREKDLPIPTWSDFFRQQESSSAKYESLSQDFLMEKVSELMTKFRERRLEEGGRLVDFIAEYLKQMEVSKKKLLKLLPQLQKKRVERLKARVSVYAKELDQELQRDLATEVSILLEKLDVAEECDRLAIHLERFNKAISEEARGGKYLDFLCQEIFREINTLNNKSQNAEVSALAIEIKTGVEKIREQVQNLV
jgi:uncharacterized protein (TIGR00255 family)